MKKITTVLKCVLFLISGYANAQTTNRVEFRVDEARNLYNIFPIADRGLIIGYIPVSGLKSTAQYMCIKLDTNFHEQKSVSIDIPSKYILITNFTERQFVYLMFSENANKFKNYIVVRLNTSDMNFIQYHGSFKSKIYFKELVTTKGLVYLGGTMHRKPFLCAVDMNITPVTATDFVMSNTKKGARAINAITVDDSTQSCDMLINAQAGKKHVVLFKEISNYKFCKETDLIFPDQKEPNSAKIHVLDNNHKSIAGTYGSALPAPNTIPNETEGIFYGSVVNNKQDFLKFIPYRDFRNFMMTSSSGAYNVNINFHDFLVRGDETLLFGEVYYPVILDDNIFAGYRCKGGVIIALDKSGNVRWENGLEIQSGAVSNNTNFKFRFIPQTDGGIKIVYSDNNIIRSKIIYNGIETKNLPDVKVGLDNIDIPPPATHVELNGVEYWYGESYLVYAVQKINKDASEKDKSNKTIFYLNTIKLKE